MSKGTFDKVKVRYGIVEHSNMVSDLHKWDCLMTAGLMQRPYSILMDCESINEAQNANLWSAVAYAALTVSNGASEREFYDTIVKLCEREKLGIFQSAHLVDDDFESFKELYRPVIQ